MQGLGFTSRVQGYTQRSALARSDEAALNIGLKTLANPCKSLEPYLGLRT